MTTLALVREGARPRRVFGALVTYHVRDLVRSRWLLSYGALLALSTDLLFRFTATPEQALLALSGVILLVVPLVALMLGATCVYASRDFTEVLLAQPIGRRQIVLAQFAGFALPLATAGLIGVLAPLALHPLAALARPLFILSASVVALSVVFSAVAQLIAVRVDDRVRGLGIAIACWLLLALVYDGLVLVAVATFSEYPIERPMLAAMMLNPIDLARLTLMVELDGAALLGYTGAVFRRAFDDGAGLALVGALLATWVAVPVWLTSRLFARKDF